MREVIIDGVRYVPARQSAPDMDAIIRGLLMSYWGVVSCSLDEAMSGVHVYVNDNGMGEPIEEVLAEIAAAIDDKP